MKCRVLVGGIVDAIVHVLLHWKASVNRVRTVLDTDAERRKVPVIVVTTNRIWWTTIRHVLPSLILQLVLGSLLIEPWIPGVKLDELIHREVVLKTH